VPIGTDIRQAVILALESQGADALTIVSDGITQLQQKQVVFNQSQADGTMTANEYIKATQAVQAEVVKLKALYDEIGNEFSEASDLQRKLGQMEKETSATAVEGAKATAAARRDGTQAIADHIVAVRQELSAEKELAAAFDREDAELEQLNQAFIHNSQNVGMATAATRQQIQALKDMGIIQSSVATTTKGAAGQFGGFATAAEQAADRTQRMGYAALVASNTFQDMQYGVGAVANNIGIMAQSLGRASPWLTTVTAGLGGPMGLGAMIMGVTVAGDLLVKNWSTIAGAFGGAHIKDTAEDMRELAIETAKSAAETERLARAEELRETIKKQQTTKPEDVTKMQDSITKAYVNGPKEVIDKGLDKYFGTQINAYADLMDPTGQAKGALASSKAFQAKAQFPAENQGTVDRAQAKVDALYATARQKFAADLALKGAGGMGPKVAEMALANPQDFGGTRFGSAMNEALNPGRAKALDDARDGRNAEEEDQLKFQHDAAMKRKKALDDARELRNDEEEDQLKFQHDQEEKKRRDLDLTLNVMGRDADLKNAAKDKDDREAKAAGDRMNRQHDAAQRKADAADHKAGGSVGKAYIPMIQGALAQNALQGEDGADQEQLLAQMVGQLQQRGASPGVAVDVVKRGLEAFNQEAQKNFAATNDVASALVATLADATNDMQQLRAAAYQTMSKLNRVGRDMSRGQTQGATRSLSF
jgi:hypothetical protein